MKTHLQHALAVLEGMAALGHIRPDGAQHLATVKTAIHQAMEAAPADAAPLAERLQSIDDKIESLGEHVAALMPAGD